MTFVKSLPWLVNRNPWLKIINIFLLQYCMQKYLVCIRHCSLSETYWQKSYLLNVGEIDFSTTNESTMPNRVRKLPEREPRVLTSEDQDPGAVQVGFLLVEQQVSNRSTKSPFGSTMGRIVDRCQFHQHFTSNFFILTCFAKLFST